MQTRLVDGLNAMCKVYSHVISSFVVKKDNRYSINPLFHITFQKLRLLLELALYYSFSYKNNYFLLIINVILIKT